MTRHVTLTAFMIDTLPEQLTVTNMQYTAMEAIESCLEYAVH